MNAARVHRPLRVLVVEPAGLLWGSERALLDALAALPREQVELAVCLPPRSPLAARLASLGVRGFPHFVDRLHQRARLWRGVAALGLLQAGLRFRPDVIHVNQAGASRIALAVGRALGCPVVAHVRLAEDVAYLEALGPSPRRLPAVLCVSEAVRALFHPGGPVSPDQLVTLYDPFSPTVRASVCPSPVLPRFLCVGRLAETKAQDVLLHALAVLRAGGFHAEAVFVGAAAPGDRYGDRLAAMATAMDLDDRVQWVGLDPSPERHVEGATALVCPSHQEPLGRVLLEAWDAGTVPIVWARSGGAAEVIEKSGGGLRYADQTGESLALTLREAAALTASERSALVESGRRWTGTACDPSHHADRLLTVWHAAADRNARPQAERTSVGSLRG